MANENKQPLDAAFEATLEQAHQAIEQNRAEIARSQKPSLLDHEDHHPGLSN